jgi:hypothetical protein
MHCYRVNSAQAREHREQAAVNLTPAEPEIGEDAQDRRMVPRHRRHLSTA